MIDNQTQPNNPILTSEQIKAIEYSKSILLNLESEISIAQKTLKQTKSENEKAIKNKSYQEELLNEVFTKVSTATSKLVEIESQVLEKNAQLNNLLDHIREETVSHETKSNELQDREEKIVIREAQLDEKDRTLNMIALTLDKDTEIHNQKVIKLKEFTSTL